MHIHVSLKKILDFNQGTQEGYWAYCVDEEDARMTATIRYATEDDLAAIQVISDAAYAVYVPLMGRQPAPMLADYAAHLSADMVLVALDESADLRGSAVVLDQQDGFWLENIAVDPATQGQGFGRQLIDAVEAWLRPQTDRYRLYTNVKMTANIEWYRRASFTETGRYQVNGFDRVYFEKDIPKAMDNS